MTNVGKKSASSLLVPPDGGWGWVIILATCINLMVIPTTLSCFGILVPHFVREFDTTIATVSWIPAIVGAIWNLTGPWTSALLTIYSHRRLGIVGTVITFLAIFSSSFVHSIGLMYLTYGIMLGIGCGISSGMGVLIVQEYFLKKRALANGIAMAGGSIGQIVLPMLLQIMVESYGFRGGLLIYSGIILQSLVAATLFQPSRWHWEIAAQDEDKTPTPTRPEVAQVESPEEAVNKERSFTWNGPAINKPTDPTSYIPVPQTDNEKNNQKPPVKKRTTVRSYSMSANENDEIDSSRVSSAALNYIGSVASFASVSPMNGPQLQQHPSSMTLQEMRRQLKVHTQQDQRPVWLYWMPRCPAFSSIISLELFKDSFFVIASIAIALSRLTYQEVNVLVPSYAQSMEISPAASASLVTILAMADAIARFIVPVISDRISHLFSTIYVYLLGFIVSAVGSFVLALSTNYTELVIGCVIYGFGIGGMTGLTMVVMVQQLGLEKLAAAYGLNVFITGLVVFPGVVFFGYVQDMTNSFSMCFHIVGGVCLIGGFMWAFLPVLIRREDLQRIKKTIASSDANSPL